MGTRVVNGQRVTVPTVEMTAIQAEWTAEDARRPTNEMVNAERDRRIEQGTDVTLTGGLVVPLQGRTEDKIALHGLATAASLRVSAGDLVTTTRFRDRNNTIQTLTPPQIVEMWSLGAAWVESMYEAAWALKDNPGGIPTDYATNESHWP